MSEETTAPAPALMYPQTKVRISATYAPGKVGQVSPAGQPETVEIELNDDIPADLLAFVDGVIRALFRNAGSGAYVSVDHGDGPSMDAVKDALKAVRAEATR